MWLEKPGLLVECSEKMASTSGSPSKGPSGVPLLCQYTMATYSPPLMAPSWPEMNNCLPPPVPAGILTGGVDFGLDAFTASRAFHPDEFKPEQGHFSTEILYREEPMFTDGDILHVGDGIAYHDSDLIASFEPMVDFLGTDAVYILLDEPQEKENDFLPMILKFLRGGGL